MRRTDHRSRRRGKDVDGPALAGGARAGAARERRRRRARRIARRRAGHRPRRARRRPLPATGRRRSRSGRRCSPPRSAPVSRFRWHARSRVAKDLPGRSWLLKLVGLPLVVPSIVAVFGIVAVYGRSGWINDLASFLGAPRWQGLYGLSGILHRTRVLQPAACGAAPPPAVVGGAGRDVAPRQPSSACARARSGASSSGLSCARPCRGSRGWSSCSASRASRWCSLWEAARRRAPWRSRSTSRCASSSIRPVRSFSRCSSSYAARCSSAWASAS